MHFQPLQRLKIKKFSGGSCARTPLVPPPHPIDLPLRPHLVRLLVRSHLPVATGLQRAIQIKFHVTIVDFEISR